jgi:hypothetical protein
MKPGRAAHYTIASDQKDEHGLQFTAVFPSSLTDRNSAWKTYLKWFFQDDTPKNRAKWKRRGYRIVKVCVTVEDASAMQSGKNGGDAVEVNDGQN